MASIDRRSLYSTSTLVGGGDEEFRGRPWSEYDDAAIQEEGVYQFQPNNNTRSADRDSILSRQSSVTTLYAQPPTRRISTQRRPPQANLAPLASLAFASTSSPRNASQEEENDTQYDLRVPWWSTIMPSPVLDRRRSSARMRINSTSNASSNLDRTHQSSSSSSAGPATPSGMAGAIDSPLQRGSNSSPLNEAPGFTSPIPPPLPSDYTLHAKCYCEENAYLLAAYLSRTCHQWNEHEAAATKEAYMRWDVDVIVVSNKNQTVALWEQEAGMSASDGYQVVWDYHVFVIVSCQKRDKKAATQNGEGSTSSLPRTRPLFSRGTVPDNATSSDGTPISWAYDLDSRLSSPITLTKYLSATFGIDNGAIAGLNKRFQPLFRVISANDYFVRFGSDRSHMKNASTTPGTGETSEYIQPRPEWDLILGRKAVHSNSYFLDSFVDMRVRVGDGRFGVIVKLEELYNGQGLMSGKEEYQEDALAAGVAVLLDRVGGADDSLLQEDQDAEVSQSQDSSMIPLEEDEMERTPGVMIGGVVRLGVRPPPPPPDGATIALNRGKRIMDPRYPAYILKAYEHRLAEEEANSSAS